jgi:c-di-AMP phosphodiesterase-like protein
MGCFERVTGTNSNRTVTEITENNARNLLSGTVHNINQSLESLKANPFGMIKVGETTSVRWNPKETR